MYCIKYLGLNNKNNIFNKNIERYFKINDFGNHWDKKLDKESTHEENVNQIKLYLFFWIPKSNGRNKKKIII